MAIRKQNPIIEKRLKPEHVVINGIPLPEWKRLSKKERDKIRKEKS